MILVFVSNFESGGMDRRDGEFFFFILHTNKKSCDYSMYKNNFNKK